MIAFGQSLPPVYLLSHWASPYHVTLMDGTYIVKCPWYRDYVYDNNTYVYDNNTYMHWHIFTV